MEDLKTKIGTELLELRRQKGLSGVKLAAMCGIDASNLSKIERGKYNASVDLLEKILTPLDATIRIEKIEGL